MDHVAAAKAAEAEYHALCDRWAAAADNGADLTQVETGIFRAQMRFMKESLKAGFKPHPSGFRPATFLEAGNFTMDDGTSYSFVIGSGDRMVGMYTFARTPWPARSLPIHGPTLVVIPKDENVGPLETEKAIREGEGSGTLFRVPYTLGGDPGTVEFRVADFSIHADRGTVNEVLAEWRPTAAATRRSE